MLANAVWRAGRKCAVLRGLAMALLEALLPWAEGGVVAEALQPHLLLALISCLDEEDAGTRATALRALVPLLALQPADGVAAEGLMGPEDYKRLYPELLKRLDDALVGLRIQACAVLGELIAAVGVWHARMLASVRAAGGDATAGLSGPTTITLPGGGYAQVRLDDVHWREIVEALGVHLDDPLDAVQEAVAHAPIHVHAHAGGGGGGGGGDGDGDGDGNNSIRASNPHSGGGSKGGTGATAHRTGGAGSRCPQRPVQGCAASCAGVVGGGSLLLTMLSLARCQMPS